MTREEAIENIKGILEEATQYKNAVCYVTSVDEEPLKMAIADMEKQIPKKPQVKENGMFLYYVCPKCEQHLYYARQEYCDKCGTHIDWTGEGE